MFPTYLLYNTVQMFTILANNFEAVMENEEMKIRLLLAIKYSILLRLLIVVQESYQYTK